MDATTAINLINEDIVHEPAFKITARSHTERFQDCIVVHFEFCTWDSSREKFQKGIVTLDPIWVHVDHLLMVGDLATPVDLMFELLKLIMKTREHEAREFLRIKSRGFDAPFHPHRLNEMLAYSSRTGRGTEGMVSDLLYGAV